jgi:hypothetical protein
VRWLGQVANMSRYLEEIRVHMKQLKKQKATGSDKRERKKEQKRIDDKRQHLKVLIKYINKDYAQVKNRLVTSQARWHHVLTDRSQPLPYAGKRPHYL